jgi:hypothetical protein
MDMDFHYKQRIAIAGRKVEELALLQVDRICLPVVIGKDEGSFTVVN